MKLRRIVASIVLCLFLLPILTVQVAAARKDGGTSGGAFSAQTFTSTNVPIAIPDFDQAGITSTVSVPSLMIVDVNLVLEDLEHTCVRDLRIELTSPAGTKVTLVKSTAGGGILVPPCSSNFVQTKLDDQAPANLASGTAPYTGSFNVEHASVDQSPLSKFNGEDAGGTWTLTITDRQAGDTGTLKAWSLVITPPSLHFAQFADGGGLSSQIMVSNTNLTQKLNLQIFLNDNDGQPLTVDLNGADVPGVLVAQVPASGLAVFQTDGVGPVQVGSVTVLPNRDASGVILFAGPGLGLAGVGSSEELPTGFSTPVEVRASPVVNTGIAVQNIEMDPVMLTFELLGPQGNVVATSDGTLAATGGSVSPLPGLGHSARFASELVWVPMVDFSNFRGTLRVTSNGRIAATAIQTRPGQFATLPVTPR